jgi:hypothetical protein
MKTGVSGGFTCLFWNGYVALRTFASRNPTRKKALHHNGFLMFLTPSAMSAVVCEYQAVEDGCERGHFGRPACVSGAPLTAALWRFAAEAGPREASGENQTKESAAH